MKFFVIISILIFSNINAQTYTFDFMFHYQNERVFDDRFFNPKFSGEKSIYHFVIYKNSLKSDIFLIHEPNSDITRLYDFEHKKIHHLKTTSIKDSLTNEINYDFAFEKSMAMNLNKNFQWHKYNKIKTKWHKIDNDSMYNTTLDIYLTPKKRKPFVKVFMDIEPSDDNHFDAFISFNIHGFEFNPYILSKEKILVKKAEWISISGTIKTTSELKGLKPVSFSLNIPKH